MKKSIPSIRRLVCCLLCLVITVSALSACSSSSKPIKQSSLEAGVIATCEGFDICYDELRYITRQVKDAMELEQGKKIWEDAALREEFLPELRERVEKNLTINYAIFGFCKDYQITAEDPDIETAVQASIDEAVNDLGGRKAYLAALEEDGLTDHFLRLNLAAEECRTALIYMLVDADLLISDVTKFLSYAMDRNNFCATYHIYIQNDPGDSVEANRAQAEAVYAELLSGTPITSLMGKAYNEDVYQVKYPYYFTHNEMDPAYEEAAFALEDGGISPVVSTDKGFYVICRQPLDESYILNHITTLMQQYQYAEVNSLLEIYRGQICVEWTDYGRSLDLTNLK